MASLSADWCLTRVAEFRGALGLSQLALAERVGLSRPTLAKIEEGGTTKRSTIDFLVTRLQEDFGEQFAELRAEEVGENTLALHFERRPVPTRAASPVPSWTLELNALAAKIMEITNERNAAHFPRFHADLLAILEAYEKLSDQEIFVKKS